MHLQGVYVYDYVNVDGSTEEEDTEEEDTEEEDTEEEDGREILNLGEKQVKSMATEEA